MDIPGIPHVISRQKGHQIAEYETGGTAAKFL
jgi:hypothetical protein